ncbi:MAG TPA: D-alanine--D-serine ligase VanG [Candidatus Mediterraneibacter intestinigallinarum]|nr:D-alanine--D-serine ligase VanG [Candidatus Mediterraneibacter intestinigallinarum]
MNDNRITEAGNIRKRIAVLFGGCSTEYEVSLQSAHAVIENMDTDRYEQILIGISRQTGQWYLYQGSIDDIPEDKWFNDKNCTPVWVSTDKTVHGICYQGAEEIRSISLDAAFPILHGKNGEDGTVQGMLELAGIPVVGCGMLSSAVGMDKELSHRVAAAAGVPVAETVTVMKPYDGREMKKCALRLGYPLFVKPVRAGSSFGITRVCREEDLIPAVELAFEHDSEVILEEQIRGFEVGCAVLGNGDLFIGEVDEIELSEGFFNYEEKYTLKTSNIYVPARIPHEKAEEIRHMAGLIYRALKCRDFARVDMFLTPEGKIYFNEVNTIPGFTAHSRYPGMMKAAGISFRELIGRLIEMEVGA